MHICTWKNEIENLEKLLRRKQISNYTFVKFLIRLLCEIITLSFVSELKKFASAVYNLH